MLTCNQNIRYQQNMKARKISMVVLGSNIWPSVKDKIAEIVAALSRISPGSFEFIEIAPPPQSAALLRRSHFSTHRLLITDPVLRQ